MYRAVLALAVVVAGTQGSLAGNMSTLRTSCVQRCVDHYGDQAIHKCQKECLEEYPEEE